MSPRTYAGLMALCALVVGSAPAPEGRPTVRGIGVIGDSYSDEYRFYAPGRHRARGWVELLAETRGLNFGPLSTGPRPEPRNAGFAYNWARSAATTDDMIRAGQHLGLAEQVKAGEVDVVVLFIGGNDFIAAARAADPVVALPEASRRARRNLNEAVSTLRRAGPEMKLALFTVPDVRDLPELREEMKSSPWSKALADAYSSALAGYNAEVRRLGLEDPKAVVIDLERINRVSIFLAPSRVIVADRAIDRLRPGDEPGHFFLSDRRHLGTVGQGMIAKIVVEKLNLRFGLGISPIDEREILAYAGKVWDAGATLAGGEAGGMAP